MDYCLVQRVPKSRLAIVLNMIVCGVWGAGMVTAQANVMSMCRNVRVVSYET